MRRLPSRGFTLIELLVVIAIIGIISSVILTNLNGAREKTRNTQRIAAVRGLLSAFGVSVADGGVLPDTPGTACLSSSCYGSFAGYTADPAVDAFFAQGIAAKPADPPDTVRPAGGFIYYKSDGGPAPYNGLVLPAGYVIGYYVEPPVSNASCGPGYIWDSKPNYISCIAYP